MHLPDCKVKPVSHSKQYISDVVLGVVLSGGVCLNQQRKHLVVPVLQSSYFFWKL